MTKSYLALAAGVSALALSTAAFADGNTAYTNQSGSNETMIVTQTGSFNTAGASPSFNPLQQSGSGNSLVVNQSGSFNAVYGSYSATTSGSEPNTTASAYNDFFFGARQNGTGNTLNLNQSGTGNQAGFSQTGKNNGNIAAVPTNGNTGMGAFETPNYANTGVNPTGKWNYVNQTGTSGNVVVRQDSYGTEMVGLNRVTGSGGNGVIANQGGVANSINLTQTTGFGGSNLAYFDQRDASGAIAIVNQSLGYGSGYKNNLVDIRQSGAGSGFSARQTGAENDLFVVQSGNVFAETNQDKGSFHSGIVIRQTGTSAADGDRNYVSAYQGFGNSDQHGYNQLTVDQIGKKNNVISTQAYSDTARFSQTGTSQAINSIQSGFSTAYVTQYGGDGNSTTNTQLGGGRNTLTAIQDGTSNVVKNSQTNTNSITNDLIVYQLGSSLLADSVQNGYGIKAFVDQYGSNNTYTGNQQGNTLTATVLQGASFNTANVVQTGSSNTTTIRQNR